MISSFSLVLKDGDKDINICQLCVLLFLYDVCNMYMCMNM
jgi:hypothetical protein